MFSQKAEEAGIYWKISKLFALIATRAKKIIYKAR
jgi:hypothetical protein